MPLSQQFLRINGAKGPLEYFFDRANKPLSRAKMSWRHTYPLAFKEVVLEAVNINAREYHKGQ